MRNPLRFLEVRGRRSGWVNIATCWENKFGACEVLTCWASVRDEMVSATSVPDSPRSRLLMVFHQTTFRNSHSFYDVAVYLPVVDGRATAGAAAVMWGSIIPPNALFVMYRYGLMLV